MPSEKKMIHFTPSPKKALETLLWISNKHKKPTAFVVAKLLFFADKLHLEKYGRPIIGDTYIAMENGPVPSLIYNIIRKDGYHLDDDTLTEAHESFDVVTDPHPTIMPRREPDCDYLSESDIECLNETMVEYGSAPVSVLYRDSHANRAYREAERDAAMDYELIMDCCIEDRNKIIQEIKDIAPYMVF